MEKESNLVNKDLILREKLAWERTSMANDRTLLSFIRTSLYFSIAGMTINELVDLSYGETAQIVFWLLAGIVLIVGIINYIHQKRKLQESKKHIGNYLLELEDDL